VSDVPTAWSLEGRVALVTGTSRGLGRALACALAAAGATVACTARTVGAAGATAEEIATAGGRARAYGLDVTRPAQIAAAVAQAERELGAIDVLVNNAGATLERPSVEVTDAEWDDVLATNVGGAFRCARAVAPGMMARGHGKIVNIGSMYGRLGVPRYAAYCASKAAIEGLTRSLATEWARHGIQVNCVAPGYVDTDLPRAAMADERTRARFLSRVPARRIGRPDEIGPLVVYLAGPGSDFMTGQTLYIDGGQTIAW